MGPEPTINTVLMDVSLGMVQKYKLRKSTKIGLHFPPFEAQTFFCL
jgi:hypothetical protein